MIDLHWLRRSVAVLVGLVAAIAVHLIFVNTFLSDLVRDGVTFKTAAGVSDAVAFLLGMAVVAAEGRTSPKGDRSFHVSNPSGTRGSGA